MIDTATKIDREFDPRAEYDYDDYICFHISREMNTVILNFMSETGYRYGAWAHKNLFERGIRQIILGRIDFYRNTIRKSRALSSILEIRGSQRVAVRVLRYRRGMDELRQIYGGIASELELGEILLIGLISRKIRHNDRRDFSEIPMNGFYPPKLIKVDEALPTLEGEF